MEAKRKREEEEQRKREEEQRKIQVGFFATPYSTKLQH